VRFSLSKGKCVPFASLLENGFLSYSERMKMLKTASGLAKRRFASHPTEARAMSGKLLDSKNRTVTEKARKTIADLDKNKR
jgi:hypothetical protein